MSEPFLPAESSELEGADPGETGAEEFAEVEEDPQPDVLPGDEGDDEDDPAMPDPSAAGPLSSGEGTGQDDFRTPRAGDRLDDAELAADLRDE